MFASLAASVLAGAYAGVANTAFDSLDVLVLEGNYQESGPFRVT